jgi:hypothetical protein
LDKDYNPIETALIAMKSTQKKKSKTWNSMMQSRRLQGSKGFFCPPSWATAYKLITTKEYDVWYNEYLSNNINDEYIYNLVDAEIAAKTNRYNIMTTYKQTTRMCTLFIV